MSDEEKGGMVITPDEMHTVRQWFDCCEDATFGYLQTDDYQLAQRIYKLLGMRVPNSVKDGLEFGPDI